MEIAETGLHPELGGEAPGPGPVGAAFGGEVPHRLHHLLLHPEQAPLNKIEGYHVLTVIDI